MIEVQPLTEEESVEAFRLAVRLWDDGLLEESRALRYSLLRAAIWKLETLTAALA